MLKEDGTNVVPSFWLLADNSMDLGGNLLRIGTFVAYLKHALLFHQQLLLSDSLVVNTPNFRRALQSDPALRDLMTEGCLKVARRKSKDGESLVGLAELREIFRANSSMNPGFFGDPGIFMADEDISVIDKSIFTAPYEVSALGRYFTDSITSALSDERLVLRLGEDAPVVKSAIMRRIEERGTIDQTFFQTWAPDSLPSLVKEDVWQRCADAVCQYQAAYYMNAIPSVMGADVVFSHEHEDLRKILRKIDVDGPSQVARIDLSRGAKSLYEAALSTLSASKIKFLRSSDEFKLFQGSIKKVQELDSIHDPEIDAAIKEVHSALHSYHGRIDSVLKVRRAIDEGTQLLDRWHLRGHLKDGTWLVRMGANVLSRQPLRVAIATTLAELLYPGAADIVLKYYAYGGLKVVERKFDNLPIDLDASNKRRQITSSSRDEISSRMDVMPKLRKDSLYGPTPLPSGS